MFLGAVREDFSDSEAIFGEVKRTGRVARERVWVCRSENFPDNFTLNIQKDFREKEIQIKRPIWVLSLCAVSCGWTKAQSSSWMLRSVVGTLLSFMND